MAIALAVAAVLAVVLSARHDVIYENYRVWWYSAILVLYFSALVPPLVAMTQRHHKYVLYVVMWGLITLAFVLVMFYLFYFALVTTEEERRQWERVLNLPPVLAAAVAAAIGWYAAHQLATKNHRTNNSFSLVMQTRCNAEFLKHANALQRGLAPPSKLETSDAKYFSKDARQTFEDLKLKKQSDQGLSAQEAAWLASFQEHKLEAVEAAIYMLNFFEFMAYGICANDLDEGLLYETISPHVVSLYQRTTELRAAVNGGDRLSFEHLYRLVQGYTRVAHGREVPVEGWERRLEIERASM